MKRTLKREQIRILSLVGITLFVLIVPSIWTTAFVAIMVAQDLFTKRWTAGVGSATPIPIAAFFAVVLFMNLCLVALTVRTTDAVVRAVASSVILTVLCVLLGSTPDPMGNRDR